MYYTSENVDKYFTKFSKFALWKRKAKRFDDKFYANYSDVFFGDYNFASMLKNSNTIGCCHFFALLLAKATPNSKLQTGELDALMAVAYNGCKEPFEHSWVEVGDYVLDTTSKQIFKKDYYYQTFKPIVKQTLLESELQDDKQFFLQAFWALKKRELFLEDNFLNIFSPIYNKNKHDKNFMEKFAQIKNNEDIYINFNKLNNYENDLEK